MKKARKTPKAAKRKPAKRRTTKRKTIMRHSREG